MVKIKMKNGNEREINLKSYKELFPLLENLIQISSSIENISIHNDPVISPDIAKKIEKCIIKESECRSINIGIDNLYNILNQIENLNKFFTIKFHKIDGESRIINGIPHNYKETTGNGTFKQTSSYMKEKHNLFQCYEVQTTNLERLLNELQNTPEKTTGFKRIKIENIEWVKVDNTKYIVKR